MIIVDDTNHAKKGDMEADRVALLSATKLTVLAARGQPASGLLSE